MTRTVVIVLFVVISVCHAQPERDDCRVLAKCDAGASRWLDYSARGEKGEPGVGVDIEKLDEYLRRKLEEGNTGKRGSKGPKRYYYIPSLTWESSNLFCKRYDEQLCSFDEICPINSNGGRQFVDDVLSGDHWVPVRDSYNEWVEIGDDPHPSPCFLNKATWGSPPWGMSTEPSSIKGFVYCCPKSMEEKLPDLRYQFIGKTATYQSSADHCRDLGMRLCYAREACRNNNPSKGRLAESEWIAVYDQFNEWIQIGSDGTTCRRKSRPNWGVRTDRSKQENLGYVYCCKDRM